MDFLKLLLHIGLILTTMMTVRTTENSETGSNKRVHNPLPYNVTPIHYDIRLIPNIEESNFNVSLHGEYNVSIEINTAMHDIRVHLQEMKIEESATTLIRDDNGAIYRPSNYTYNIKIDTALLTFNEELSRGSYILHIKYIGNLPTNPRYKFSRRSYTIKEGGRVWLAIIPFMPVAITGMDTSCWGKPAVMHTFNISVKHNHTFRALSNMPIRESYTDEDGMVWTHFNITPFISTCLVAVALTDYVHMHDANETLNMWCRSQMTSRIIYAQNITEKVREFMTQYTASISEKISKIDQVAIPNFSFKGLAHWGLIIYNESDISYNETTYPPFRQTYVAKIIAHEVSHQWFGCLITPSSLSYTWLNEGMASFFQAYILDKIFKNWRMIDFLVIDKLHVSLSEDTGVIMDSLTPQIFDPSETRALTYSPVYSKTPVVLRMLQHAVTDDVFRNGILTYLNTYQFSSATPDDLWSAMEDTLKVSTVPHKDFGVKEVMDTWMNQRHYPLVNVTRNYETGETTISQDDFRLPDIESGPSKKWWVPVTFATKSDPTFYNTIPYSWLSPSKQHINLQIDPNDWIIVNVQQIGYYRVTYDPLNWQRIIQCLKSEEYTKIHVLNRAQIIDDAFALMTRKLFDLITFFDLMNYLPRETDYIPWYPVFRNLAKLSRYFPLSESEHFKSHMAGIFNEPLKYIGYEEGRNEDDITKLRRANVVKWACLVGNLECKRMATVKLDYHLTDPNNHKVLRWWYKWTYCSGLMIANKITWDRVMDLFMQERDENLLEFLACSENSDIIFNYLDFISSNNSTLRNKYRTFALKSIIFKHARNNLVLDYMLGNFERIKPKLMTTIEMLKDIISNVYRREQLDKIQKNVEDIFPQDILAEILPIIASRLVDLINFRKSFSAWFVSEEKQIE